MSAFSRVNELESSIEDMRLMEQEAEQAVMNLESKIASHRSRNPMEPVPFELFSDFCNDWMKKCRMATDTVRFQLRKARKELVAKREVVKEKQKMAGSESFLVDHEALQIQKKDNEANLKEATKNNYELGLLGGEVKRNTTMQKIKLSESMRQYGKISDDCVKLEKNLETLQQEIERAEEDIIELEAINAALREKAEKYQPPSILQMAQKVGELEQAERELVRIVKKKIADVHGDQ